MSKKNTAEEHPIAFISYSWDSIEHQEWVLKLADDLMGIYGIDVILDQNELSPGKDLTYFMESSIESAAKVLLILTPKYKIKAEGRTGGVGFEYAMILQSLFEVQAKNNKFIPVLREGTLATSSPSYVKTKVYHDMTDDAKYLVQLNELAQFIYNRPKREKPKLAPIADFSSQELDPLLQTINDFSAKEKINDEINAILDSRDGLNLAISEVSNLFNLIKEKAKLYAEKTNLKFQTEEDAARTLILRCQAHSVVINWSQAYLNTLSKSTLSVAQWAGHAVLNRYNSYSPFHQPKMLRETEWSFDLNTNKEPVWSKNRQEVATSAQICDSSFAYIIERISTEKSKDFRE